MKSFSADYFLESTYSLDSLTDFMSAQSLTEAEVAARYKKVFARHNLEESSRPAAMNKFVEDLFATTRELSESGVDPILMEVSLGGVFSVLGGALKSAGKSGLINMARKIAMFITNKLGFGQFGKTFTDMFITTMANTLIEGGLGAVAKVFTNCTYAVDMSVRSLATVIVNPDANLFGGGALKQILVNVIQDNAFASSLKGTLGKVICQDLLGAGNKLAQKAGSMTKTAPALPQPQAQ